MAEELSDGSQGGYGAYCEKCGCEIKANSQGNEIGTHDCVPIKIPEQIGCIIPIWGHAVNSHLKDFVIWFNENYTVTKK